MVIVSDAVRGWRRARCEVKVPWPFMCDCWLYKNGIL